jgi:hypothetical protein
MGSLFNGEHVSSRVVVCVVGKRGGAATSAHSNMMPFLICETGVHRRASNTTAMP